MADNYLEKKMEEHRSRTGVTPRRHSPTGLKPGTAAFSFGRRSIIVYGVAESPALAAAVVRALGDTGSRVAFLSTDLAGGQRLAQSTGTRHYPWPDSRIADVRAAMAPVDFEVRVRPGGMVLLYPEGTTEVSGTDCDAVAEAAVYALLPLSRRLRIPSIAL